ncbi:hypothetical protein HOY80DRAFT_891618, partial [Tuber brumale]
PGPAACSQGPTHPTLRANSFPEVTYLSCRLSLSQLTNKFLRVALQFSSRSLTLALTFPPCHPL